MNFEFSYGGEDASKTLNSLIKYNRGAWKSTKQRTFALSKILKTADACYPRGNDNVGFFGVPEMKEGQSGFLLEGLIRWCDYGSKSVRPVAWYFIIDEVGVVAQYKIRFQGEFRTGVSVNPSKTELLWTREEGVEAPVEPIVEETSNPQQHVGEVGTRICKTLREVKYINKGYGPYGEEILTIWNDNDGNVYFYNNLMCKVEHQECVAGIEVQFTIKSHIVNKSGQKVNVISRMALSKAQKLVNALKG